jgi:uncharacterized protein VirK/YbjX
MESQDYFLNQELSTLETTATAFGQHFIPDAKVRKDYIEQTKKFSQELKEKVSTKKLTPQKAAQQAQSMRNTILEAQRTKSSSLGLSIAKFMKKEGKTLAQLEIRYAEKLYGKPFTSLGATQRNSVWKTIVQKSGEPQVKASNGAKLMGRAGRGLFVLTIIIAVYHIAIAEDKVRATANEGVAVGGGMAGATALGAAGLVCGPAAIACVPIGIFAGGILGAIGADWVFDQLWN